VGELLFDKMPCCLCTPASYQPSIERIQNQEAT
jgi:hypothetical protein